MTSAEEVFTFQNLFTISFDVKLSRHFALKYGCSFSFTHPSDSQVVGLYPDLGYLNLRPHLHLASCNIVIFLLLFISQATLTPQYWLGKSLYLD